MASSECSDQEERAERFRAQLGGRETFEEEEKSRYAHWTCGRMQEIDLPTLFPDEIDLRLDCISMASWVCTVLRLSYVDIPLESHHHGNPVPYANWLLTAFGPNARWICILEYSPKGIVHAHCMIQTLQRTDNCSRTLKNAGKNICDYSSYKMQTEILKASSCKSGRGMLCYMLKNPSKVVTSTKEDLITCYNVRNQGLHLPYKQKHDAREAERQQHKRALEQGDISPDTGNDLTTYCLTQMINAGKALTLEELCTRDPEGIKKYLHRQNLSKILTQCGTYYEATKNSWNPYSEQKWLGLPKKHENIHKYLFYQRIDVQTFDFSFYQWLYKKHSKRNTLILQGPSNTGKSSFIKGLLEALGPNVAHICNGTFPFQGMSKKCMIAVWEEPLLSSTESEKAKQILGGEPTSVAVKFCPPAHVDRTPVLITTNHDLWRYCTQEKEAIKNRCFIFKCGNRISSEHLTESKRGLNSRCYCGCGDLSGSSQESSNCSGSDSSSQSDPEDTGGPASDPGSPSSGSSSCRVPDGYGNSSSTTEVGWSHYRISGGNIISAEIGCSNPTRSNSSSSTTADNNNRPSRHHRSSNTDHRVPGTKRPSAEFVDGLGKRRRHLRTNIGSYGSLRRLGGRLLGRRRGRSPSRRSRRGSQETDPILQLVGSDPHFGDPGGSEIQGESSLDRETGTTCSLEVPTIEDWKHYCAYLTYKYDH
uniref:Nonstructural protein 1 n=1 Tax=Turdus pallidus Chaphamaparvovirus TaxID=2794492 RepID=A0A8A4XE18_9VIRU|nr:MAG: nonstructural protein 1 [Turdus pallidus Chaphamaparvovirus]